MVTTLRNVPSFLFFALSPVLIVLQMAWERILSGEYVPFFNKAGNRKLASNNNRDSKINAFQELFPEQQ